LSLISPEFWDLAGEKSKKQNKYPKFKIFVFDQIIRKQFLLYIFDIK